jgi:hypothetical protein
MAGICVPSIAPMHPSKYSQYLRSSLILDGISAKLKSGGLAISFASKHKPSRTSANFLLTISHDFPNLF